MLNRASAEYAEDTGNINPIKATGAFASYHHWWTDYLRSALVYSVVNVDNLDLEGTDALNETKFFLVNLAYKLFGRMDLGIEYLWGERINKDGKKGRANRIQFVVNYGF